MYILLLFHVANKFTLVVNSWTE